MASSPQVSLNGFPELLLDALVSNILDVCPTLTPTFLHELGSRVHASTLKAVFSTLDIPDDVRYFSHEKQGSLLSKHPVSAVLLNPARYAHIVKRIVVNEAELPSAYRSNTGALGLITINEDDEESDEEMVTKHGGRVAVEPMRGEDLTSLLSLCGDLESFVWRSSNPPPDGIIEVLSAQCPKLSSFIFRPDPQLRAASIADKVSDISLPLSRGTVVKWDAPSFRISPGLSLTQLRLTRLSQSGSQALACFLKRLGDESLLEDVSLDLVWFDDVCEPLVKAGRRIKKLQLGTSGTKLTDKDIVMIFEGCEALEDFALVEAEARLSRKLWSKIESIPPRLRKFSIQLSESGPHHSWTADHLESFASLKLDTVTHLSIRRLLPFPQLTSSGNELEYDSRIDSVAALKPIPSDVVESIREMPSLINLQCDWWSWKLDDVKALADKCTKLEHLELALDAPFLKLLSMTSIFTPLTQLRHFAICIPPAHSPGLVSPLLSPSKLPIHPLTPAASPVRRRTSLPSPVSDFASQVFVGEDAKVKEQGDISFPPLREIKKFVKKCPKLLELEWYGRNARGRWLISRPLNGSSKLGPNVSVEYIPPVASAVVWTRATLEKAALDFVTSGNGSLSHNIPRQGQAWTGPKAEEFRISLEKDKEQASSSVTASAVGGTRDKSSKAQVFSSNNKRRERVSISSSESTSGSSGTGTGSPGTKLVQPETKTNNIIPSPISPISPLSQSLCMGNTTDPESSPIEDQVSPYQPPSLSRSIPDESPIRIDHNYREGRSRRATLPDINIIPTTTTNSGMSTFSYSSSAFPRAFRMNNQSRFETRNSSIGGKNNGNTISADHPRQDSPRTIRGSTATSTTTSNPRGRGSFYPHGAPRRGGGFGRGIVGGDNNKRGFVNGGFVSVGRSVNGGGSSNNNGHSRRGNTASIP